MQRRIAFVVFAMMAVAMTLRLSHATGGDGSCGVDSPTIQASIELAGGSGTSGDPFLLSGIFSNSGSESVTYNCHIDAVTGTDPVVSLPNQQVTIPAGGSPVNPPVYSFVPPRQAIYDLSIGCWAVGGNGETVEYCHDNLRLSFCDGQVGPRHVNNECEPPDEECKPIYRDPGKIILLAGSDKFSTHGRINDASIDLASEAIRFRLKNDTATAYDATFVLDPFGSQWKVSGAGFSVKMRVRDSDWRYWLVDDRDELSDFTPDMLIRIDVNGVCFLHRPQWYPFSKGWKFRR